MMTDFDPRLSPQEFANTFIDCMIAGATAADTARCLVEAFREDISTTQRRPIGLELREEVYQRDEYMKAQGIAS